MAYSAVSKMVHRAEIERDSASGETGYNTAPAPSFSAHLSGVKCFVWSNSRREAVDEDKSVVLETLRCLMPIDTDVTEEDRISSIEDRRGNTIYSGPLHIDGVQRHRNHLELILERRD